MSIVDEIADRYAKQIVKKEIRKISKIVYKAVFNAFKEGCMRNSIDTDFCNTECKMWDTEYRCRDCKK